MNSNIKMGIWQLKADSLHTLIYEPIKCKILRLITQVINQPF